MECMWLRLRMIPVWHRNKSSDLFLETRWSLARRVELKDPSNDNFWWRALPHLRRGEQLHESKHAAWFSLMDLLFPLKCGAGVHQSDAPVQHCLRWNESCVALLLHSPVAVGITVHVFMPLADFLVVYTHQFDRWSRSIFRTFMLLP